MLPPYCYRIEFTQALQLSSEWLGREPEQGKEAIARRGEALGEESLGELCPQVVAIR